MGLFKAMYRRTWKKAVSSEFHKRHGVDLQALADVIGPATLDELLNDQYECAPRSPAVAASNVARVLSQSFGINVPLFAMRSKIASL
jgi:hypothetical protein